jgi:hypothetical protein
MAKFRKRPVIVEAVTFDELVAHARTQVVSTEDLPWSFNYTGHPFTRHVGDSYLILTLEGTMVFRRGDMLIVGVNGEVYPCKMDIFEKTYEPVLNECLPDDFNHPTQVNPSV